MPSIAPKVTSVAASSLVVKTGPGVLHAFTGASTAAGWWLIYDALAAPADGTVTPVDAYPVTAGGGDRINYDPCPLSFKVGCVIVCSSASTPYTQTQQATGFVSAQAE